MGTMTPAFAPDRLDYTVGPDDLRGAEQVTVTPTAAHDKATITVEREAVYTGAPCAPIAIAIGRNPVTIVVTAEDGATTRTYSVVFLRPETIELEAYVKPEPVNEWWLFGAAVAISGNTVVIGSGAQFLARTTNRALVFVREEGGWTQQALLRGHNSEDLWDTSIGYGNDGFGYSVDISGDTIVVGAPYEAGSATGVNGPDDNDAPYAGSAYVFTRSGDTWTQEAYIKASNAEAHDGFGESVAISGDTIVVGAPDERSSATGVNGDHDDNGSAYAGAAYVFTRDGDEWSQQAYLKAHNTEPDHPVWEFIDAFGACVDVSGDTIVVGAPGESGSAGGVNGPDNNDAYLSGAAYVFTRIGDEWSQQAYLKSFEETHQKSGDFFGGSIAVDHDTIVVGATGEDSPARGVDEPVDSEFASDSGAAYVFTRSGDTWSQQAYLKASNTEWSDVGESDFFGSGVAILGDAVVVGALEEDSDAMGVNGDQDNNHAYASGAVFLFRRTGTTWGQEAYLKASNTEAEDNFGFAVALGPDLLVVGSPFEDSDATGLNGNQADNSAPDKGAAYVYRIR